jgi:6-phosphofructokinase 2
MKSHKIVTVTFNPALDKNTSAFKVEPESKIRCASPVYHPGGGGIHVSRALKKLGQESLAVYAKGGSSGNIFSELLAEQGIHQHTIETESDTRENFILVETSTNKQYRFGMPGEIMTDKEIEAFIAYLDSLEECKFLVASGSLPSNISLDVYARIGEITKRKGISYIVDSNKGALLAAFQSGVMLAKPNIDELSEFVGRPLENTKDQVKAAQEIIAKGWVEILVISLGSEGALVVNQNEHFLVKAPKVEKRSTVGAGDSMVAGIVFKLAKGASIKHAVMYGVAAGSAATLNEGTELCNKIDVERLYHDIKLKHPELV